MNKVIHQFVLALLSLSFVWVSLSWFSPVSGMEANSQSDVLIVFDTGAKVVLQRHGESQSQEISTTQIFHPGDSISSPDGSGVRLTFPGGGEMRLAGLTTIEFPSLLDVSNPDYRLVLKSGEAWITTQGASRPISLYALGGVVAYSQDDSVDVLVKDNEVDVFAAKGPVRLGVFLPLEILSSSVNLLNSILVTEGNQASVTLSNIQPKLEKLLYSKLVKEFQYGPVSDQILTQNVWFQSQYAKDKDRRELLLKTLTSVIKDRGLFVSDPTSVFSSFSDYLHTARSFFTFDQNIRDIRLADEILVHLDDAIYYYATSQQDKGDARLKFFRGKLQSTGDGALRALLVDAIWSRFEMYNIFSPQDGSLFPIRFELRNTLLSLDTSGYHIGYSRASQLVRSYLFDVSQSLHFDTSTSKNLLTSYFSAFHSLFTNYSPDIVKNPNILAEENQLLMQMYLKDPLFYQDSYFQNAFDLETQWLNLLPEGRDKNEENQTLVASKIDLMKKLRLFFFTDKISVHDATQVLFRLLSDISHALPQTDTAVVQYFKDNLDAQQDFWQYVNSADFAESKTYGDTHKERFSAFLKNKKDIAEIHSIQQGFLDTTPVSPDVKATLADIQKAFSAVGVKNLKISPLLDKDQSQVFIESADYNTIPFSGIYDRVQNLISDVKVYNETVLGASVPLDKLKNVFQTKTNEQASSAVTTPSSPNEDPVQKVAQLFILKKLQDLTFELDGSQIETVDYARKLFHVKGAKLPFDKSQITLDFSLDLTQNEIFGVSVVLLHNVQDMPGRYSLADIVKAVTTYYDQEFYKTLDTTLGKAPEKPLEKKP